MKTLMTVALALLIFLSNSLEAAQTAEGRLYCFSIRFGSGQGQFGLYKMDLTGTYPTKNGELYPIAHDTFSHYSTLIFTDETDEEIPGDLLLDVPFSDNNDDGFNDIFETALAFSGGSSGTYSFPGGFSGSINATWSRNAGSYAGTCQLHFQHLGMFTHTFNVLEYKGSITYTPGTSVVLATVEFGLSGVPGYQLKGPISFTKWIGDPQNELDFDGGDWTNAVPVTPEVFSFFGDTLVRDISRPTRACT